jgi:3-oxoacyl-[acyl-carrier protein] reductase
MSKLNGKVAIVTGASKGIGAAIARALAAEGAVVVVNYASSKAAADAVVDVIKADGGRAIAVPADVTQGAEAASLVATAVAEFGRLDILVNNSGAYQFAPITEFDEGMYEHMFDLNVRGLLLVTQAAVKAMTAGGSIVNIGSFVTRITPPNSAIYTATKAAVSGISGVLSKELGPMGIRVNTIEPSVTQTEGTKAAGIDGSGLESFIVSQTPLGRVGQVGDIAPIAVFLASDDSRWVTGENIIASGGMR